MINALSRLVASRLPETTVGGALGLSGVREGVLAVVLGLVEAAVICALIRGGRWGVRPA